MLKAENIIKSWHGDGSKPVKAAMNIQSLQVIFSKNQEINHSFWDAIWNTIGDVNSRIVYMYILYINV